jgi:multiple antibiotic resistance protein
VSGLRDTAIRAFVMLVVTVGPYDVAPLFVGLTAHLKPRRWHLAMIATLVATAVLVGFALGADVLLRWLGIGLPAFHIAGGILLLLLAIDLLFARQSGLSSITPGEASEAHRVHDIAVFPLAIPLLAGPGAITSIVLLMEQAGDDVALRATVLAALFATMGLTLVILLMAERVLKVLGQTGINVVTRIAGIVLAALAVQFVLDGIKASELLGA